MSGREAFLIRVDPETLNAVRKWADDEFRSINAQIEFILRRALMDAGRLGSGEGPDRTSGGEEAGDDASAGRGDPAEQM